MNATGHLILNTLHGTTLVLYLAINWVCWKQWRSGLFHPARR